MKRCDYKKNGIAILESCVDPNTLDKITSDLKEVAKSVAKNNQILVNNTDTLEQILLALANADHSLFLTWLRGCESLISLYAIVNDPSLRNFSSVDAGLRILHTPVRPALHCYHPTISEILLSAGGFADLKQHQDWHALQSSLNTVVFWIPLMDIREQTSRLAMWPGSHLGGLAPAEKNVFGHQTAEPLPEAESIAPLLTKGSCFAFSSLVIHKTFIPKDCEGLRLAIGIRHSDLGCPDFTSRNFDGGVKNTVDYDLDRTFNDRQAELLKNLFGT